MMPKRPYLLLLDLIEGLGWTVAFIIVAALVWGDGV